MLSQLALRGFDANLTLDNAKSVDILGSEPSTVNLSKVEVKTSWGNKPRRDRLFGYTLDWLMSVKPENIIDPRLFYCL